jgi:hypothetical protein
LNVIGKEEEEEEEEEGVLDVIEKEMMDLPGPMRMRSGALPRNLCHRWVLVSEVAVVIGEEEDTRKTSEVGG